jgi:transposase
LFFRKVTTKSGGKEYTYLKLIENYREGNKVKQRVIANLGNLENMTPDKVQSLIAGLSKICGLDTQFDQQLSNKLVLDFGTVAAVNKIWQILHLDNHIRECIDTADSNSFSLMVKLLVLNQVIKNHQRLPLNVWCKKLYMPELQNKEISEEDYNETLKKLIIIKEKLEERILLDLQNQALVNTETIFCHLLRGKMLSPVDYDEQNFFNHYPVREKVDMAVFTSQEGIPFRHRTFKGHFSDGETVPRRINELKQQFDIKKCVFVGDQHIITRENVQLLVSYGHDYIIGMEIWSSPEVKNLIEDIHKVPGSFAKHSEDLLYREIQEGPVKYLLCYSPSRAARKNEELENRLAFIEKELENIKQWVATDCSDNPRANFFKATNILRNYYCKRYFECVYNEKQREFLYRRKDKVIEDQLLYNGKFILKTNCNTLSSLEIIEAYTLFSKLKNNFRQMRGFYRYQNSAFNENLIGGQVQVSVISYLIEQIMELLMQHNGIKISASKALDILEGIKITINQVGNHEVALLTPATKEQLDILQALHIDYNKIKIKFEGVNSSLAATSS